MFNYLQERYGKIMKCEEFNKRIPEFINDTLETKYFDGFIHHSKECRECKDELEIHYMIRVGLDRIEGDSSKSFDIRGELENQLSYYEQKADVIFKKKVYKNFTICLAEICTIILCVMQIINLI